MRHLPVPALAFGMVLSCLAGTAAAQSSTWQSIDGLFPSVTVRDQDGVAHRFDADLIGDRLVAINFVFTSCTIICGPQSAIFRSLQREGARRGLALTLVSITLDPVRDTPDVLRAYAATFEAGPGWHFVTADSRELDRLVSSLGLLAGGDPRTHAPVALIVNGRAGRWTRANALAPVGALADLVTEASRLKPRTGESGGRP